MSNKIRWILVISGGIAAALPWWGGSGLFLLFCFVPLLLTEDSLHRDGHGIFSVLPFSFGFFLLWNFLVTWWLARIHPVGGMSVIVLNSVVMTIVFLLYVLIKRSTSGGASVLVILWSGYEFIFHRGDLSWPWLGIGNGLASDIRVIQWYEYTGMAGGSLWALVVNSMLFVIIRHYYLHRETAGQHLRIAILIVTVAAPLLLSLYIYFTYDENRDGEEFLIIQTARDPYRDDGRSGIERAGRLLELARANLNENTRFIVTPETAVDSVWLTDPDDEIIVAIQQFIDQYPGTGIVVGANAFAEISESERTFTTRQDAGGNLFEVFNSAVCFFPGQRPEVYHKHYLANGVEQIPFQNIFRLAGRMAIDLGGVSGSLKKGPGPGIIRSPPDGSPALGTLICFESSYGEYAAAMVRQGAELFVVMSNDGWFTNTGAYRQHLRLSQIRAVESRRSIARASNYGISCFISPRGEITGRLEWAREGVLPGQVNKNRELTFYSSRGDYIGRLALFFSALLMLNMLVRRYMAM
jgi:apolipoprotein N-acyltransferase